MSEATFLVGDVFERMAGIPDGSIDCIVTSPPFLALRSYLPADHPDKALEIGSEATPAAFLSTLLRLTAEWRRVLAPHGSICVELGDTYSGSGGAGGDYLDGGLRDGQPVFKGSASLSSTHGSARSAQDGHNPSQPSPNSEYDSPHSRHLTIDTEQAYGGGSNRVGIDRHADGFTGRRGHGSGGGPGWPLAKSLCGIPDAYALSLEYGWNMLNPQERCERWRVRNKIVWHRPNPPVGALGDKVRPSTSYITVACVSDRRWFDLDSERTPAQVQMGRAVSGNNVKGSDDQSFRFSERVDSNPAGAPLLDCWTIPTQPYSGAHYATFPQELPRRLINLMCPMHVCRTCGEPRRRIVETSVLVDGEPSDTYLSINRMGERTGAVGIDHNRFSTKRDTLGWSDCGHDNYRRGIVLDPFAGSGTTLAVATGLGRDAIGIDLDARNLDLARERIGMFLQEEVVA